MNFFADPTISTLTSGTPSQNVDLAGISFPRRLGFRIASNYAKTWNLIGQQAVWQAYSDPEFKHSLGKDFYHEGLINRTRWAMMYFKGIFPKKTAYLKCIIRNTQTGNHIKVFYFKFVKSNQTSLSGRTYVKDPILDKKIVKDGVIYELVPRVDKKTKKVKAVVGHQMFKQRQLVDISDAMHTDIVKSPVVTQTVVRYSEEPKMIFLVTPPHLMSYAKIILILIKQLTDLNFEQSYMTKSSQKPLYKTRFMLDELGNLQSEGHGISNFQTMLSIGLGQEQQFTLILQTLQQLKDVYGDSVDKIVQGNTANIIFLKSTDDSMLDTLSKMSGTTHESLIESKTVTRDLEKMAFKNEGKVSYTANTQQRNVIEYNDMAFISPRNSIVFSAGESPIWNRNETILPMSWKLLADNIKQPGHEYSFETIPTLSSARDFDVRQNQPNFDKMLAKRMKQALKADQVMESYQEAYGYNDYQIQQLDPDDYSDEIMTMIDVAVSGYTSSEEADESQYMADQEDDEETMQDSMSADIDNMVNNEAKENKEQIEETIKQEQMRKKQTGKKFAGGCVAPTDLYDDYGGKGPARANHQFDEAIIKAYVENIGDFRNDRNEFGVAGDNTLTSGDGRTVYIQAQSISDYSKEQTRLQELAEKKGTKVYSDADRVSVPREYKVTDAFLKYLAKCNSWQHIAGGRFDASIEHTVTVGEDYNSHE